ncbi:twin-arginine translocase TatA/TatE family subunit [Propionicimonas sp.]|uniref:twin-arginine translocase TatA/TatE family subunit n=1 Tax=Propionicimonas sp. TaxID=1955623 RepID=UPI00181A0011|nr:twin-arginine translocase TatA/TatE family subunit [Propionicimonas sp.]
MPGMPSGWEWVVIAVVVLVLFGGAKLAGIGKNAGKAIREFKEETAAGKAAVEPPAKSAKPEESSSPSAAEEPTSKE